METPKVGGFISEIQFNNGESLEIAENDIVIFVGPNNAGKSQSLKDIYALSEEKRKTTVITDIKTTKDEGSLFSLLEKVSSGTDNGSHTHYQVLGSNYFFQPNSEMLFRTSPYYGSFRNLFVVNLDTSARLTICYPPQNIDRNAPKAHPIHYAAFDAEYRKWLSASFKKAFGTDVIPNTQFGASIPLCIGEPVQLTGTFEDEQCRLEAYAKKLDQYKQVQDQGDGIKSFTGILLYLMLDYYRTYLLDEPESFLHPPQARIMGQIIGETLSGSQQAFIATHSEDIIKGLLETCPSRLKIVRITREEDDTNHFSVLQNDSISTIWNDPLLKHSNILSSLFHKTVVLCESDADCQMYAIIESHIKQAQGNYSETLFIHCGGKQRMARVVAALRAINVIVKLVPDLDVLNDEDVFKGIIEAYGIEWETIQSDYRILVSNLHSDRETIDRRTARLSIEQILNGSTDAVLTRDEIKSIQQAIKTSSKWENIKRMGTAAIPAGDASAAFGRLNQKLMENGIFLVPVGELECFIKDTGGHGPAWVNSVLEKHPNHDDEVYRAITDFITGLDL